MKGSVIGGRSEFEDLVILGSWILVFWDLGVLVLWDLGILVSWYLGI